MIALETKLSEIQKHIENSDSETAKNMFQLLIHQLAVDNDTNLSYVLYEYGLYLFDLGEYYLSIGYLINAYNHDYKRQAILEFLYECFIFPNQDEFKIAYQHQILDKDKFHFKTIPSFENLPIDFIPVYENCYYIYDKTSQTFCGSIDFSEEGLNQTEEISLADEFYNITVSGIWNLSELASYIKSASNRLIYVIADDTEKMMSFLKLPEISQRYLNNTLLFEAVGKFKEYFHDNPSIYLPRLQYGHSVELGNEIKDFFKTEHEYRLTLEGRKSDNLLLSICIPTYNRGNRALENVLSLLELPFDAEMQIIVSNNGSEFYQEEYEQIENMKDSRIKYFAFETNQGFTANVAKVINLSDAPFALINSDEDFLINSNLNHYLAFIKNHPSIALMRSRTAVQYSAIETKYAEAGMPAFRASFLQGNYISGFIYNTTLFRELNIDDLNRRFGQNPSYEWAYPHMWWNSYLVFQGDFCSDRLPLVSEGASELLKQTKMEGTYDKVLNSELDGLFRYAMIDSRIKQHIGFIELINDLPFPKVSEYLEAYYLLCCKTGYLFNMVKARYLKAGYTKEYLCKELQSCLLEGITNLKPGIDSTVLKTLENVCIELIEPLRK